MRRSSGSAGKLTSMIRQAISGVALLLAGSLAILPDQAKTASAAVKFETLYRFKGGTDGAWPNGDVVINSDGIIFGTTQYDGNCDFYPNCGTIFMLTPPGAGETAWTNTVIHLFGSVGKDGGRPVAPLTLVKGSLYGTASVGGYPTCGCGIVFKITPGKTAKAKWTYTILHRFGPNFPPKSGSTPDGGLLVDGDGTIYGTTAAGGKHNSGVVFKISKSGDFTVLHDFVGNFTSGPQGELLFGKDGAIYGTTFGGGKYNEGTIFRITKAGSHTVLYDFKGVNQPGGSSDGAQPEGRLALGSDGAIYGTTTFGGSPSGYGTAWSLSPPGAGQTKWKYEQLHIFGSEGNLPHSGVAIDLKGVLYGTASGGGQWQEGVVYRLAPPKSRGANWRYTVLHSFRGRDKDGNIPFSVTFKNGTIFATNISGGLINRPDVCRDGCGTVFKLKP